VNAETEKTYVKIKFKLLATVLILFLFSIIVIQQIQISALKTLVTESLKREDAGNEGLYQGNPFVTGLWSGQVQTENLTFWHTYWYNPSTGSLVNVTDLAAYPYIPISYLIWTDGTTVYAKNGSSGERVFSGDAYTVLNQTKNTLKTSGGGNIFLYAGNYTLTSTFPDENVSSTIMLIGAGRSTRLLSSGSFDALDKSLIQVRDLVWQDASGTLYDATFDPNMFQQALRTELNDANMTVIQSDYTKLLSTHVPPFYNKVKEGYAFSGSKRFESISSDANFTVLFENPSGSGTDACVLSIAIIGLAQCYVDIYDDVTVTAYGNNITIRNLNLSSPDSHVCMAYYGGTYDISSATKVHETLVPGGSKQFAIGGLSEVGETVIIPSSHNVLIVVTNKSASASDFCVQILWCESVL